MNSLPEDTVVCIGFDPEDFEKLKNISKELFNPQMSFGLRTDLANAMQVILWRAIQLSKEDLK